MTLRVLVTASEVVGFAKTGGLADVAGALPRALAEMGHQVLIVMPFYHAVRTSPSLKLERVEQVLAVPIGDRTLACKMYRTTCPGTNIPILFIDHPGYFDRDEPQSGRGLYQQTMPGGYKADYPDNAERFTFFCRAVFEAAEAVDFIPNILHANDWQTGLVPAMLQELYRNRPGWSQTRSVFTVHNIAYQGTFPRDVMRLTGLPGYLFNPDQLEFHSYINFLKAGIVFADAVNTVSPTYAAEIQTAEYGCGLEGLLIKHRQKLFGIMNGVDYTAWDPATDPHIPHHYDTSNVFENKPKNKRALLERFGLATDVERPVLGQVARLVSQKGIDLVLSAAPGFLDLGCRLLFVGEGDPEYHHQLLEFQAKHPQQVGLYLGYSEPLAHLIEAGCDLFLMPSRYEPSGLNQLYSMRYGTPPVVRSTGGLADSVIGANEQTLAAGTATGFSFQHNSAHDLYETVRWALKLYREQPRDFEQIVISAMMQDWSWKRSAAEYVRLYQKILG